MTGVLIVVVIFFYLMVSILLFLKMMDACDWHPCRSFFVRDVDTWEDKPLFKKIIVISLNIFVLPWLIAAKIMDAFNDLFY